MSAQEGVCPGCVCVCVSAGGGGVCPGEGVCLGGFCPGV